jgi:hypothetical protein
VEYPRPRGGGLLLRDRITLLYQHRLYDGIKRYQLLGRRFYHLLILHHYRLLGPETHPRRSSPATTMVAGTMGSHGQHRLAPLPHPYLVLLFLASIEPGDPAEYELGRAHVRRHYYHLSHVLHYEGKTRLYWTGCTDEERFLDCWLESSNTFWSIERRFGNYHLGKTNTLSNSG